jgi:adenylate cyclase, class 2
VIESELKIPVDVLGEIRHRLAATGAEQLSAAEHEVNILFDTSRSRLAEGGQVLRVRRVGSRQVLTFKGPATYDGAVKQRREIELEISSSERIAELLHALGFAPGMRYEKKRESWLLGEIRVELDHTPMGDFVELEGPPDSLEAAAHRLGLDPARAVAQSYISLWREHCRRHPGLGRDMVFES